VTSSLRWVFVDGLAHVLADSDEGTTLVPLTVCGLGMAATVTVYTVPPSLDVCWACVPLPGDDRTLFKTPCNLDFCSFDVSRASLRGGGW
jgi:hypothetical protein